MDAAGPGLLVIAESWDRGWSARVDGQERPIARVNQGQMGVLLPEGAHTVALDYHPRGFLLGVIVAAAALLALAVVAARDRTPERTARG